MCKFIVIGIDDNPHSVERNIHFVKHELQNAKVFSGGKRHFELVKDYLPDSYSWIDITVPLDNVFLEFEKAFISMTADEPIIVFASGDPLFYGFAVTIKKRIPDAEIKVYPVFNSLQNLAHRLNMQYDDMVMVSLTGRPMYNLDRVLIEQKNKIGILTDRKHTPQVIAQRLIDYGYTNYTVYVGELLGGEREKISKYTLQETIKTEFKVPNCIILVKDKNAPAPIRYFGIPHSKFSLLDGRENMITKMPIRLLSLSQLDLYNRNTLWDIGFCTGSVSIEAKMQFPHLYIDSFEVREQCASIIDDNCKKMGVPGINVHIADFTSLNLKEMIANGQVHTPDAVFIGGHGGKIDTIMQMLSTVVAPGCIIVYNSVKDTMPFEKAAITNGFTQAYKSEITIDHYNKITCCKVIKK